MLTFNISRFLLLTLALVAVSTIIYDDKKYSPFGLRYWLSLLALLFISFLHLVLAFLTLGTIWLLITRFTPIMLLIWGFLVALLVVNSILLVKYTRTFLHRTWYYQLLKSRKNQKFSVQLLPAVRKDLLQLLDFQQEAFKDLYKIYQDAHSPYLESLGQLREKFERENTIFYWIVANHTKVGFLRVVLFPDENRVWLSPLLILPAFQKKGLARQAMQEIEKMYPSYSHWTLATIYQEDDLVRFYESLGYHITKTENEQPGMDIIYMEKRK